MKLIEALEEAKRRDAVYDVAFAAHKEVCPQKFHTWCSVGATAYNYLKRPHWKNSNMILINKNGDYYWEPSGVYACPGHIQEQWKLDNVLCQECLDADDWEVESYEFD